MLILLSPSKTLDLAPAAVAGKTTLPEFLGEAAVLAAVLQKKTRPQLAKLMAISPKLAEQVADYYHHWTTPRAWRPKISVQRIARLPRSIYEFSQGYMESFAPWIECSPIDSRWAAGWRAAAKTDLKICMTFGATGCVKIWRLRRGEKNNRS